MLQLNWKGLLVSLVLLLALAPINFSVGDVPVTLQTFIIFLTAAIFGKNVGFAATSLYLLAGALGFPVLGGHTYGWEKFIGPTAGFLWAFPLLAYFVGLRSETRAATFYRHIGIFLIAHIILLIPGFIVLYFTVEGIKLWDTLIRLLPGLMAKSLFGGIISSYLIKKLPSGWTRASKNRLE